MLSFKEYLIESKQLLLCGGNVFKGKTASIKLEHIKPTLAAYFAELKQIFPKKAAIFNDKHFHPLGSVGLKKMSGDIDLAIESTDLLDAEMSDKSMSLWGVDPKAVHVEFAKLEKRAKTSSKEQLLMKAFLKELVQKINSSAPNVYADENKITPGNIFTLYPQIDTEDAHVGIGVQIDIMIGNLQWLKFSYHSDAYPEDSNVKGLCRTQLVLSLFQTAGYSFNHVSGVKDKETGEIVATNPEQALTILSSKLKIKFTKENVKNYYTLCELIKKLPKKQYDQTLDTFLKILDSTRIGVPDNLRDEWKSRKDRLHLTGKFLPQDDPMREFL